MRQHKQPSIHILLTVFVVLYNTVYAQQDFLSKEEAITVTLENNYNIQIADNNLSIAENNAGLLNSGYLPSIFGQAGANYSNEDRLQERAGEEPFELRGAESENYNASINLSYTLFDGLGRFYNYKSLKENYGLSQLEARQTIEMTVLQLFSVYYEVARLTENVEILEETLEISRDRVVRAQYQFDYGQNTKLEVLNAQVDVTNDSINLMNTRQQLLNTKRDLNVVMSRELQTSFVVDTLVDFVPELALNTYLDKSVENNVRIQQIESNIKLSEFDLKIAKSDFLPTVGLTGSYGWNKAISPGNAFFGGSTQRVTGFSAGLNLRWDLFDGGTTITRTKNAQISVDSQRLLKEQVTLEVRRDIANAQANYDNLLEVFYIQEQNVITNQNNFERSRERFKLGLISSIEFRQAQINLINAQTNKNLAKYDAKLAELELLQLIGQLLNVSF